MEASLRYLTCEMDRNLSVFLELVKKGGTKAIRLIKIYSYWGYDGRFRKCILILCYHIARYILHSTLRLFALRKRQPVFNFGWFGFFSKGPFAARIVFIREDDKT